MDAKSFIQEELIHGIERIIDSSPYLAVISICAGIEFLGKCLDVSHSWEYRDSTNYFRNAINILFPQDYQAANINDRLYHSLRCGLLHSCVPDSNLALSDSGTNFKPMTVDQTNRLILNCHQLFMDFKVACQKVISDASLDSKTSSEFYSIVKKDGESITAATQTFVVISK